MVFTTKIILVEMISPVTQNYPKKLGTNFWQKNNQGKKNWGKIGEKKERHEIPFLAKSWWSTSSVQHHKDMIDLWRERGELFFVNSFC